MPSTSGRRQDGFTLVEMLVVVPMAILIVGGMIAIIIFTAGSALRAQAYSQLQLDIGMALDRIEQDVRLSLKLSDSTSSQVKLSNLATTQSPYNASRGLIQKSNCLSVGSGRVAISDSLTYDTVYTASSSGLKRRTTYKCTGGGDDAWQLNNVDEDVIKSADISMNIQKVGDSGLKVVLTGKRIMMGQEISYSSEVRVKSINIDGGLKTSS